MKKKFIILGAIIVVSLIVSISAAILTSNASTSPPSEGPITCNAIQENPGGISIVFFSTEEQATEYADYFLSVVPFDRHPDKFSFYYITPEDYKPECERYNGVATLCYSKEIIQAAAVCPYDYIVVLEDEPISIRSSAYRGVMSLNVNHPLTVFAHEFYHVFDNAAEEYYSPGANIPRESENCQSSCGDFRVFPEFEGEPGCYETCTEENYYREAENGFMRSLQASSYGQHNELILEEEIGNQFKGGLQLSGFVTQAASSCAEQEFYIVEEGAGAEVVRGCTPGGKMFGPPAELEYKSGETKEVDVHSDLIFITDYDPTPGAVIMAESPQEVHLPLVTTIPKTGQESQIIIPYGDESSSVSLIGVGARPCKN
jgi:hypothetical protein